MSDIRAPSGITLLVLVSFTFFFFLLLSSSFFFFLLLSACSLRAFCVHTTHTTYTTYDRRRLLLVCWLVVMQSCCGFACWSAGFLSCCLSLGWRPVVRALVLFFVCLVGLSFCSFVSFHLGITVSRCRRHAHKCLVICLVSH